MAYLIEVRFTGYAKKYSKRLIYAVSRKFRVKGVTRKRAVPHITLFGPFTTKDEKKMVSQVVGTARKCGLVPFKIKGFNYFDRTNKVIYLDVEPSKELEQLRRELAKRLLPITNTKKHDGAKKFYFHATIAFKDIDNKFDKIWEYLKKKEEPNINQHLLRITILKGGKILYEYDMIQKRLLTRKQALSKYHWKKTISMFKSKRKEFVIELEGKKSLIDRIKSFFGS